MHILMILPPSDMRFPLRTQLLEIFGTYLIKKHKISLILFSKKNRNYIWRGFHIYEIPFTKKTIKIQYFISFLKKLKQIISDEKIDLIFGRNVYVIGNLFYPISKILKVPLVLQLTFPIRSIYNAHFLKKQILTFILRYSMKLSDLILPISHWMGWYLQKTWKLKESKIFAFPDGVNIDKFKVKSSNREINEITYPIIYIGTLSYERKLEFLIKAMEIVVEKCPNAKLLIVGWGTGEENLKLLTKKLNLTKNIKFTGEVPYSSIPEYLNRAFIGVTPIPPTPYYKISSPLKLYEYMGAGLAVVANEEIIEHKEAIMESKGGNLAPYNEIKFADAIIDLLKKKEKLKEMGKRNIEWVSKYRSYKQIANDLEQKLIQIVENYKK